MSNLLYGKAQYLSGSSILVGEKDVSWGGYLVSKKGLEEIEPG